MPPLQGKRAAGRDRQRAGTAVRDVAELRAFLALRVLGGREHLFHSLVSTEEVERGEEGRSVGRCHRNNHGGCPLLFTAFRVRVKVTCSENGDSPGILDGPMKRGEELIIV